jgi:hypothetical protein
MAELKPILKSLRLFNTSQRLGLDALLEDHAAGLAGSETGGVIGITGSDQCV